MTWVEEEEEQASGHMIRELSGLHSLVKSS